MRAESNHTSIKISSMATSLRPGSLILLVHTRNSPGDEIANVNFRITTTSYTVLHALQNTIDSCMNSATDRRGYVLEHRFTKFIGVVDSDD